jgi:hypothetical protein
LDKEEQVILEIFLRLNQFGQWVWVSAGMGGAFRTGLMMDAVFKVCEIYGLEVDDWVLQKLADCATVVLEKDAAARKKED